MPMEKNTISQLSKIIDMAVSYGLFSGIFITGFLSAFLSSTMNNLPSVMIMNLAIEQAHLPVALE